MAFNRLLDADIDARNRRTAMRHLPAGLLSRTLRLGLHVCLLAASFSSPPASWDLSAFCSRPLALALLFFYSFAKRFTMFSHLILGFCLGIAPAAAWIAMRGSLDPRILWLTAAVMFWTAGFDVIYACQDFEFDAAKRSSAFPTSGYRRALCWWRAFCTSP